VLGDGGDGLDVDADAPLVAHRREEVTAGPRETHLNGTLTQPGPGPAVVAGAAAGIEAAGADGARAERAPYVLGQRLIAHRFSAVPHKRDVVQIPQLPITLPIIAVR